MALHLGFELGAVGAAVDDVDQEALLLGLVDPVRVRLFGLVAGGGQHFQGCLRIGGAYEDVDVVSVPLAAVDGRRQAAHEGVGDAGRRHHPHAVVEHLQVGLLADLLHRQLGVDDHLQRVLGHRQNGTWAEGRATLESCAHYCWRWPWPPCSPRAAAPPRACRWSARPAPARLPSRAATCPLASRPAPPRGRSTPTSRRCGPRIPTATPASRMPGTPSSAMAPTRPRSSPMSVIRPSPAWAAWAP